MPEVINGRLVQRLDSIAMDTTYFTDEGYLMDTPIVTTVGIFEYINPDGTIRRELRLPENVFDPESLSSYKGKPIIVTHAAGVVDKDNVVDEIIGTILSDGIQDGDSVKAQICIHDTETMTNSGLKELSLGYSLELDETPGVWNGQNYDAIQKNIRINHLALVGTARAGKTARLNIDSSEEILKGGKVEMNKTNNNAMTAEEIKKAIETFNEKARLDGDIEITIPAELIENGEVNVEEKEVPSNKQEVTGGSNTPEQATQATQAKEDDEKSIDEIRAAVEAGNVQPEQLQKYVNVLLGMLGDNNDASCKNNADTQPTKPVVEPDETQEGKCEKGNVNMDEAQIAERVEKLVQSKLEVCRVGEKLGLNLDSISVEEAKRQIVAKVEPSVRLDGISDSTLDGMYLMAKAKAESEKSTNLQLQQMFNKDGKAQEQVDESSAASARQRMIENRGGNR